ncbi:hypothetical protein JXB31_02960 [Candidatus Woesearchaeota archaeon]|nr:hypothetical protein [Candidatus Woesearchaeota archaeon]
MNDRINRVEFWKIISERKDCPETEITRCIDNRVIDDPSQIIFYELTADEAEAIKKGFMPDGYYSACEIRSKSNTAS